MAYDELIVFLCQKSLLVLLSLNEFYYKVSICFCFRLDFIAAVFFFFLFWNDIRNN